MLLKSIDYLKHLPVSLNSSIKSVVPRPYFGISDPLAAEDSFHGADDKLDPQLALPDVNTYHETIEFYPGWKSTIELIQEIVSDHRNNKHDTLHILEMGAGSGRSTELLSAIPNIELSAVERDPTYFNFLKQLLQQKKKPDIKSLKGNINQMSLDKRFDALVSMFSISYLKHADLKKFLIRTRQDLLKRDGILVVGNEFLPFPGDSIAQAKYHGNILYQTILDRQPKLAQWILEAWQNAENKTGEQKMTTQEFENLLNETGFHWKRWRRWPEPYQERQFPFPFSEGGVYVYKAWVPR